MRTLKYMGIIGIVSSSLCFVCLVGWSTPADYEAAIGWGIIGMLYALALSIVVVVKSNKK